MNKIKKIILDIIYPVKCIGCGQEGVLVCDECLAKIKVRTDNVCPVCNKTSQRGEVHDRCQAGSSLDGLIVATEFDDQLLDKIIYAFKYNFVRKLSADLVSLIIKKIVMNDSFFVPKITAGYFDLVVAVPLHPRRQLWRGFNQSVLLADEIAGYLQMKTGHSLVVRQKYTSHQAGKVRTDRQQSLQGAFVTNLQLSLGEKEQVKNKKILLVDDVFTSGATMQEVAKVLKDDLKVSEVWGVVLARSRD